MVGGRLAAGWGSALRVWISYCRTGRLCTIRYISHSLEYYYYCYHCYSLTVTTNLLPYEKIRRLLFLGCERTNSASLYNFIINGLKHRPQNAWKLRD